VVEVRDGKNDANNPVAPTITTARNFTRLGPLQSYAIIAGWLGFDELSIVTSPAKCIILNTTFFAAIVCAAPDALGDFSPVLRVTSKIFGSDWHGKIYINSVENETLRRRSARGGKRA
jgi:hypothetical protein